MSYSRAEKLIAANKALRFWHNRASQYPDNYALTFEQLLAWIDKSNPEWRVDFGSSCLISADYRNWSFVQRAMEDLADYSDGKLPQYSDGFFYSWPFGQAIVESISGVSLSSIKFDSVKIGNETIQAAKNVAIVGAAGLTAWYAWGGLLGAAALVVALQNKK